MEWGFGRIATYWAFCDFHKNQKLYLQQVGKQYVVATILTSLLTCFYGSEVSTFYNVQPPTPANYLATPVPQNEPDFFGLIHENHDEFVEVEPDE